MLNIAICDDNALECSQISKMAGDVLSARGVPFSLRQFSSGERLIESEQTFDIIFLDIVMEQTNGISAAKLLRQAGKDFILVFITASKEYMPQAFDVETFNYLVKPVSRERLEEVLLAAHKKLSPRKENHFVYTKNGHTAKISLDDVCYFESLGRLVVTHLKDNRTVEFYGQFSEIENFFRCHKSYLVNLGYVAGYDSTDITLDSGWRIPLAKRRLRQFAERMLEYLKKEGGIF